MAEIAELIFDAPAGCTMQLLSMSASEGLSRPFEFQVEILCDKPNVALADCLGKSMTVAVSLPDGSQRYFNGLVARFAHSGRRTRQYFHYQATLRPWFWFLSRTQDCKIFQDKTVVQIIEEVLADHGSLARYSKNGLTASYTNWVYCVQYRESDMNFVSRLMEQEGIYYYFEHTASGHELVLCDAISAHSAVAGWDKLPYRANWAGGTDLDGAVRNWSVGMQVLPMKVVLGDFDFERPARSLSQTHTVSRTHALSGGEIFDYPGEYQVDGDGTAYARIRAQELQAGYRVASAQTDARGLSCGHTFKVEGLPDNALDGEYLVLSTNVYVEEGVQIGPDEGGSGQYVCDFQVMPTADSFRAARTTPKPMVYGPQTAKVVGPSGEPVHTDKYGRVKVQFHWDRLGKNDDKSSCWIRVSQPWAGNGFGFINIPRVGDEVVVSFLEGDPDQPLITGRVYNASFMPPYDLPANSHTTSILSRSMGKTDGDMANELRFCDKPGEEYIWLQAQKDFHREVENNDHDTIKNDQYIAVAKKRQEDIGTDLEQTIGGKAKIKVASDYHVTAGGDHLHDAGGVININAGGDFALESGGKGGIKTAQALDIKAGMDVKTEAGMSMHIKAGMSLTIESGMSITLKAGAGTIVIGPGTISIDAPMVNINGGGGGGSASAANPAKPSKPEAPTKPTAVKDPLSRKSAAAKTSNSQPAAKTSNSQPAAKSASSSPAAKSSNSSPAAKSTNSPPAAKSSNSQPLRAPAAASTRVPVAAKTASTTSPQPLGGLSMQYETGKTPEQYREAAAVVSSGKNDPGGISYGAYQMSSTKGVVQQFLNKEGAPWAKEFTGLDPSQPGAFGAKWKEIAAAQPDAFYAAQHDFIKRTHYDPVVAQVLKKTGVDVNAMPGAVKDAVWSTSVQHGGARKIVTNAVNAATSKVSPTDPAFASTLVNSIYDERSAYVKAVADGLTKPGEKQQLMSIVNGRFVDERTRALKMLGL